MELVIRSKVQYSSQMAIERQDDQQIFQMIGSAQVASAATSCGCCSYSDADVSEPGLFFLENDHGSLLTAGCAGTTVPMVTTQSWGIPSLPSWRTYNHHCSLGHVAWGYHNFCNLCW